MKSAFLTIAFSFIFLFSYSQTPLSFNYQGVARKPNNECLKNVSISFQINIRTDSATGPIVYKEEFRSIKTSDIGAFSFNIGNGIRQPLPGGPLSDFEKINWFEGEKWLEILMDTTNGFDFVLVGSQQLVSVPYAMMSRDVIGEPVGTVKLFWNANGTLKIPERWMVLDGSTVNDPESPLNGVTLPDMNNCYAVGTTGSTNNSKVGNPNHTIDLSHSHKVNSHSHSMPSHTHGPGSLRFRVANLTSGKDLQFYRSNGSPTTVVRARGVDQDNDRDGTDISNSQLSESYYTDNNGKSGTTSSGGGGNTGSSSPGTDSKLSSSQSIQPESIGFLYIIKIK